MDKEVLRAVHRRVVWLTALLSSSPTRYDMPGSGKCIMEYAMRLFALRAAEKGVNSNVVVPGVTKTDASASPGAPGRG